MLRYLWIGLFILVGYLSVRANNVKVSDPVLNADQLSASNFLVTMTCTVSWDNSWRDAYNYDAVYLFFKFKKRADASAIWGHVYLDRSGVRLESLDNTAGEVEYDYWLSPLETENVNKYTGIYIFRKREGAGKDSVAVKICWNIKTQNSVLDITDFLSAKKNVLVSAHAIEMVYIPGGPYRIGDGVAGKGFYKSELTIRREDDLVDTTYQLLAFPATSDPKAAANHINDNTTGSSFTSNAWVVSESEATGAWWQIDFGKNNTKKVTYFAINGAQGHESWFPSNFRLQGWSDNTSVTTLWEGSGEGVWAFPQDAYPATKAIKIQHPQEFRYYRFTIDGMKYSRTYPVIKTIAMTDKDLEAKEDFSVLIQNETTAWDTIRGLAARDGGKWFNNTVPATYPNGFHSFFTMKYELSQEEYVRYLNKLTLAQQKTIFSDVTHNKLELLKENEFAFGGKDQADYRNGIIVLRKIDSMSVVFACDLNENHIAGEDADGAGIACNYMNASDMLAYADWAGLRPLTEMEYEKMARPFYPYRPLRFGYVWNTNSIQKPQSIENPGESSEHIEGGNANYAGVLDGPVRTGAFATVTSGKEKAGASFWGVMDLGGNLRELYYNVNNLGLKLDPEKAAHGDGYIHANLGQYDGNQGTKIWSEQPAHFIIRGGGFADDSTALQASDRSFYNRLTSYNQRDENLTFRLGRTAPAKPNVISVLKLENGQTTERSSVRDTICIGTTSYTIVGNQPVTEGAYVYIWYLREQGGEWKIIEGENGRDLTYSYLYPNLTSNTKTFEFKRRIVSSYFNADPSSENIVTIMMNRKAVSKINRLRDTIKSDGKAIAGFYMNIPGEDTDFTWKWRRSKNRWKELPQTLGSTRYSHYVPESKHFLDEGGNLIEGEQIIEVTGTPRNLKKCPEKYKVVLEIEPYVENPIVAKSQDVICGNRMKDTVDGKIYATVAIRGLDGMEYCWMAENLNFDAGATGRLYALDAKGNVADAKIYGRLYTWWEATRGDLSTDPKKGICPKGWRLPDNADWNNLKTALQAPELKVSKYWTYASDAALGNNRSGFTAIPSGFRLSSYQGINNYARFWSADRTGSNGYYYEIRWDNSAQITGPSSTGKGWYNNDNERIAVRCIKVQ